MGRDMVFYLNFCCLSFYCHKNVDIWKYTWGRMQAEAVMRRRTRGGFRSWDNSELLLEKAPWHWVDMEWMTSQLQRKNLIQFMSISHCDLQETRFKVFRQTEVSWRCVNIHCCERRLVVLALTSPKQQSVFILKATHLLRDGRNLYTLCSSEWFSTLVPTQTEWYPYWACLPESLRWSWTHHFPSEGDGCSSVVVCAVWRRSSKHIPDCSYEFFSVSPAFWKHL